MTPRTIVNGLTGVAAVYFTAVAVITAVTVIRAERAAQKWAGLTGGAA